LFVVFLLGVYAGRGMDAREVANAQQLVRLPVASATEDDGAGDKWTFDETLEGDGAATRGGRSNSAPPRDGSLARDGKTDAAAGGARAAEAHGDEHRPADAAPAAAGKDATGDRVAAAAKETDRAERKPERAATVETEPTPRARIAVAMVSTVPSPQAAPRGDWSVQVTATRDPRTADAMVQRLKAHGYQAYVQRVQRSEGTLYRVRVGRYPTLETANQMVSRLRREPGVPEAFVASD
jgi:cell division septation protein DedD